MARTDISTLDLKERVVVINRVSKAVEDGHVFKFAVLVVIGDSNETVGFGIGKTGEIPDSIRKEIEDTKKNLIKVSLRDSTIPHETIGTYGVDHVLMKPVTPDTGVIAGGAVRVVVESTGIKDIHTKALCSNNPRSVVHATTEGLAQPRIAEEVTAIRGKPAKGTLQRGGQ